MFKESLIDIKKTIDIPKITDPNFEMYYCKNVRNIIMLFYNVLKNNIDNNNLSLFYKNIESLEIKNKIKASDSLFSLFLNGVLVRGSYDVRNNTIYLANYNGMLSSDITHELLHMSSALYDYETDVDYCGLSQNYDDIKIGYALNEGCTELYNKRFFPECSDECYAYETLIASLIEFIISKENLEKYYFNADLLGIVNDLSLYSNRIKVDRFLIRLDYLLYNLDKIHILPKYRKKVDDAFNYINEFLIETSLSKEINNVKNGYINKTESLDNFILFGDKINDIEKLNLLINSDDVYRSISPNIDRGIKVLKRL